RRWRGRSRSGGRRRAPAGRDPATPPLRGHSAQQVAPGYRKRPSSATCCAWPPPDRATSRDGDRAPGFATVVGHEQAPRLTVAFADHHALLRRGEAEVGQAGGAVAVVDRLPGPAGVGGPEQLGPAVA